MSEPLRISGKHARRCGFCASGVKDWCARNGVDARTFFVKGMTLEDFPEHLRSDADVLAMFKVAEENPEL